MGSWNETNERTKLPTIFSQTTVNFLLELILLADKFNRLIHDREAFIADWLQVDWNSRESILTVLPFIETAYVAIPATHVEILRDVSAALGVDGYRIREGKLRKIVPKDAEPPEVSTTMRLSFMNSSIAPATKNVSTENP